MLERQEGPTFENNLRLMPTAYSPAWQGQLDAVFPCCSSYSQRWGGPAPGRFRWIARRRDMDKIYSPGSLGPRCIQVSWSCRSSLRSARLGASEDAPVLLMRIRRGGGCLFRSCVEQRVMEGPRRLPSLLYRRLFNPRPGHIGSRLQACLSDLSWDSTIPHRFLSLELHVQASRILEDRGNV